ncbi:FAD NAD(P)-binding domain-containing [Pyrrhoderma noxium]|uniref:FAD NAD(P)-binding domain-containing n=1 Tax=Pyrrhoderma noxium TaxID=2282107 RepID=A0A286UJZ9_9AGAM|nr:FAD NAD(P)-binding domain-containing [Pyrrhoderma noxium]
MKDPKYKFTVAICGGGIAGLTAALAIAHFSRDHKDILIDIYESSSGFTEIGAGVSMYRRPWEIMKALNLEQPLREIAEIPESDEELRPSFEMRKSDQKEGITFSHPKLPFGIVSLHRAHFLDVLAKNLDLTQTRVHFSKRLVTYSLPRDASSSDPIVLHFQDGTSSKCDILVGADGIHSIVRQSLLTFASSELEQGEADKVRLRNKIEPLWSGTIAYRALIPSEKLRALNPSHRTLYSAVNYGGKDKHIVVFPISQGQQVNVVAFVSQPEKEGSFYDKPWVHDANKDTLYAEYEGWEDEVQQLLQCVDMTSIWAIHALDAIPICSHNRVTLIGDAAHAMTPHLGSGAGVAIEDAYVLGAFLASPMTTISSLPGVLRLYQSIRLPKGNEVQHRSRIQGKIYEQSFHYIPKSKEANLDSSTIDANDTIFFDIKESLEASGKIVEENRKWVGRPGVDEELKHALELLQTTL